MNIKINKLLSLGLIAGAAFLSSCERGKEWPSSQGKGDVIVKMLNAGEKVLAFDVLTTPQSALLVDIRKDAPSEAALNSPTTVKVSFDQAYMDAYNEENDTEYELLPANLYTTDIPVGSDGFTINMSAGQFAAPINFTLTDATKLDLSRQYAFPLTITSVDGSGKISVSKTAFVKVLVKNSYHGTYHATGVFIHPTAGERPIDEDKELVTSGTRSVTAPLGDLGASGYYMDLLVNADNTVTISPKGATPNIDQSWGDNYYDPATKRFHLHYSYNVAAPRIVKETIELK